MQNKQSLICLVMMLHFIVLLQIRMPLRTNLMAILIKNNSAWCLQKGMKIIDKLSVCSLAHDKEHTICVNGNRLNNIENEKFLGAYIDTNFTFKKCL